MNRRSIKQHVFANPATTFAIAWVVLCSGFSSLATSQEFRIDSEIYSEDAKLPVAQNLTLFSQGVVYDFQLSSDAKPAPVEIVIFNSRTRTLNLLDIEREVQLELSDLRLLKIFDAIRKETVNDPNTKFLIEDEFNEDTDWSSGWVTLTAPSITYRYKGKQPSDLSVMPLYFEFLDHFTRLITTDPQKIPPFARIKLNQSIKRRGWLPSEVQISVSQNDLFRHPYTATSKHVMVPELSDKDRERIAEAKRHWLSFKRIKLAEYRGLKKKNWLGSTKIATKLTEPLATKKK